MVAEAGQEPPGGRERDVDRVGAEAAGVDLDGQEDPEVVQQRRDEGVDQHLEVRDLEELGDDEGGGPQRGRGEDRPDSGGGQNPARRLGRVAGPAQDGPRDGPERDGGGHPGAGDRSEQEPRQRDRPARGGARPPEGGEAQIHEEPTGPGVLEDRAVDGEEHDVGGGDVERHPVDALRPHVELGHQTLGAVAAVGDRPVGQVPAVVGVAEEAEADQREDGPHGPAGRLEHQD